MKSKFKLGMVAWTPGARSTFNYCLEPALQFLERYARGDFGDVCPEGVYDGRIQLFAEQQ